MISIGENKSILCKGDFHPAQLYKGDKKIAGYESAEFSGNGGVTLEDCYNDNLHNVVIHGNSVQDGTPNPENPIEVQSVGISVPFHADNLFDSEGVKEQGTIDHNGIVQPLSSYPEVYCYTIAVKSNTSYTFNTYVVNNYLYALYNENMEFIERGGFITSTQNVTFNTTSDTAYVKICTSMYRVNSGEAIINEGTILSTDSSYKYKIPVKVRGKNFINEYRAFNTSSGLRVSAIGNLVTINGRDNANVGLAYDSSKAILLKAGKTYTVSRRYVSGECLYSYSNSGFYVGLRKADNSWLANLDSITTTSYKTANRKTFTVTKDTLCSFSCVGNGEYNQLKMTVQLEEASNLTAHEPYIEPQTFNIYLDAPLRKIGGYKDYIDFENGKVVRNVGKTVYTGNENWLKHDTKNLLHYASVSKVLGISSQNNRIAKSSHIVSQAWVDLYQNISRSDGSLMVGVSCVYNESAWLRYIYVCPYKTTITVAEWQALLRTWYKEGNPFTVWYAIPSKEEAIELPKLPQFKGTTIYEVDTEITASISGKYKKQV